MSTLPLPVVREIGIDEFLRVLPARYRTGFTVSHARISLELNPILSDRFPGS